MVRNDDIQLMLGALRDMPAQLRRSWRSLVVLLAVSVAAMSVLYVTSKASGVEIRDLTRDPAAVADAPWYIGLLSTAGVLLWGGLVALCLVGWRVCRSFETHGTAGPAGREPGTFLLASAVLFAVLGIDDAFMLHDRVLPDYLGIREYMIYLAYMLGFALYAWRFRRVILRGEFVLMGAGLGMLGLSMTIDKLGSFSQINTFFEDGFKFTGMVLWGGYYSRASLGSIRAAATQQPQQPQTAGYDEPHRPPAQEADAFLETA